MSADKPQKEDEVARLMRSVARLVKENAWLKWRLSEAEIELGKRTPLTKGFTQEDYLRYHEFKTAVLERDDHTCQDCGCKGSVLVHHIYLQKYHPHLRYEPNNGVTLCVPCHSKRHSGKKHHSHRDFDPSQPV